MITQNSVRRMLQGCVEVLEADVLPEVQQSFPRMQLMAMAELLRNLAARVDWNSAERERELVELSELAECSGRGHLGAETVVDTTHPEREHLLKQISQWIDQVNAEIAPESLGTEGDDTRLEAVLARQVNSGAKALHSTMYRSPSVKEGA